MSSKHYYYPTISNGLSKVVDRDRVYDKDYDRASSRYDSSDYSEAPSLSRASTPSSFSSPPTPTLTPALPTDSKLRDRHVEFASPVAHAYRRAESDELSVMRAFASHAGHCDSCGHSIRDHRTGSRLCDRGAGLAKDLGAYFYCFNGKPHSNTDRRRGQEKVQVEVPVEYKPVKGLFEALDKGLSLKRSKPLKPEIYQPSYPPRSPRPATPRRYTTDSCTDSSPSRSHRHFLDREDYDLRPARSESRRPREPIYRALGGRYVDTRPSYLEEYSDRRRSRTPSIPLTHQTPLTSRTRSSKYSSGITDSELKHLSENLGKRRSRRYSDTDDHYRSPERYSRPSRRRDSFDDRLDRRVSEGRRRRSSERFYGSDDGYRRAKPLSSYLPSSFWR